MPFVPAVTLPAERAPRRRTSWIFGIIALLLLLAPAAFTLPRQVNAVAWLAGAGRADTFTGYGYSTSCSRGCVTVTDGILASTGQGVTWSGQVPLGKPVPVRDPVWDVMSPRYGESVPDAVVGVGLGLFFDPIAICALAVFAVRGRRLTARARGRSTETAS